MGDVLKVADTQEIPSGTAIAVEVGGQKVALFNIDGTYYAIADTCTHRGGPLSEGQVEGTVVTCPWHGACFDVTSGSVVGPPAARGVTSYKVQVDGTDIKIEIA